MNLSPWKEQLYEKPLFGCFVTFASPALTEFIASMGFDFTLIDNEHAAIDQVTLENMVRASQCAGVPSIIRIPINQSEHIQRSLDFGANGIQVPHTSCVDSVQKVVKAANFPPHGERGVAFLPRAARYGMHPNKEDYLAKANETKLVAVHIETVEAVDNLDSILETEGIDVFFIGPGDLAISMGYAHNPNHEDVLKMIENCIRKIKEKGKIAGTYAGDVERARMVIDWGATYIVTAATPYMTTGISNYLKNLR